MGTCKMGDNPKTQLVNKFGKCHEMENLFISDSSIFLLQQVLIPHQQLMLSLYVADCIL